MLNSTLSYFRYPLEESCVQYKYHKVAAQHFGISFQRKYYFFNTGYYTLYMYLLANIISLILTITLYICIYFANIISLIPTITLYICIYFANIISLILTITLYICIYFANIISLILTITLCICIYFAQTSYYLFKYIYKEVLCLFGSCWR